MKKNLFGASAVLLAIIFSSFTIIEKENAVDMYVFEYDGDYSIASVQDLDNYEFTSINDGLCSGLQQAACKVAVTINHVIDPSGVDPELNPATISITASQTGTKAEIASITGSGSQRSNRPE